MCMCHSVPGVCVCVCVSQCARCVCVSQYARGVCVCVCVRQTCMVKRACSNTLSHCKKNGETQYVQVGLQVYANTRGTVSEPLKVHSLAAGEDKLPMHWLIVPECVTPSARLGEHECMVVLVP